MAKLNYLLDTHTLLWFQGNEARIPTGTMDIIQSPDNIIFFSQISLFEIVIKQAIGKLPEFKSNIDEIYHQAMKDGFTFLPVLNEHLTKYLEVPFHDEHRDPFDRLLIATGLKENAVILTADRNFSLYADLIKVLW